jgi:hypothetical protein
MLSMATGAPPWMARRDDFSDTLRYRAMTPDERLTYFVEVCSLAQTILQERPDRAAVLARTDPMPPPAERRWRQLVAQARRARPAW